MKIERRPYETKAVRDLRLALRKHRKVLAVAPTGAGKTVIASLLIKQEPRWRKVLWVTHRRELVDQANDHLVNLGLDVGVVMSKDKARRNAGARVQVASLQSIHLCSLRGFNAVVFDEAHRAMADSYQRIAKELPRADILGLTATPCRMDGRGLGDFFRSMLVMATHSQLYDGGFLAKPEAWGASAETIRELSDGLRGVRTQGGDFAPGQLAAVVDRGVLIGRVVKAAMEIAPKVPKVVFACSVRHSRRIAAEFRKAGIKAAHLDGETNYAVRADILERLANGTLEVVCNVDVLSEGWDMPELGAVIIARPTKSKARYLQMVGRALRVHRGRVPIIVDHGCNVQRFNIVPGEDTEWTLERGDQEVDEDPKVKECESCQAFNPWGATECRKCGAEIEIRQTPRQDREEKDARLAEITRAALDAENAALRGRIEYMARKKNAPAGWAEKVFAEVTADA